MKALEFPGIISFKNTCICCADLCYNKGALADRGNSAISREREERSLITADRAYR